MIIDGESTIALTLPCPYHDSTHAEFWALLTLVRAPQVDGDSRPILILCDNRAVVNTVRNRREDTGQLPKPSRTALGTWQLALKDFLEHHPIPKSCRVEWIKAHVGFQGNELADAFSKWASFAYAHPDPPAPLPP